MDNFTLHPEIRSFFTQHILATLATKTNKERYPHLTPVFYMAGEHLNLYFMSHEDSKKIKHILVNPRITIAITDHSSLTTLQLKGVANIVEDAAKKIEMLNKLYQVATKGNNNSPPPITKLAGEPVVVFEFTTEWFRYSNFAGKEAVVYTDGIDDSLL